MTWTTEIRSNVHIVTFDDEKANTIAPEFLVEITRVMDEAETQKARALVLRGRKGRFSAGLDLKKLPLLSPDLFQKFCIDFGDVMLRLFSLPIPTLALVEGHALAGGAVLLLGCDRRIGVTGEYSIGLNESQIHLPLPSFVLDMARAKLSSRGMLDLLEGHKLSVDQALDAGYLTDKTVDAESYLDAYVKEVATFSNAAFATTKHRMYDSIRESGQKTCRLEFDATNMPGSAA